MVFPLSLTVADPDVLFSVRWGPLDPQSNAGGIGEDHRSSAIRELIDGNGVTHLTVLAKWVRPGSAPGTRAAGLL